MVERVDANPRLKSRFGPWFFTWVAVSTFMRRYLVSPPRLKVLTADGEELEGVTAIVQNGAPFTYFQNRPIDIAEGASLDSGTLAGGVLHRATPLTGASIAWRALSRNAQVSRNRRITGLPDATGINVTSADGRPLPLQVDGDYLGEVGEARFSVLPEALNVVA